MEVGLLTAPFRNETLEHVARWAADAGFDALEVASGPDSNHCDPTRVKARDIRAVKDLLAECGIRLSSLACYRNTTETDPELRKQVLADMKRLVDVAAKLDVDIVCTMAGFPVEGKSKMQTIEEVCPRVFGPLCKHAAKRGVKIALENWFQTNIQNLAMFQRLFEVVPDENFGLNFDPSHLVWQGIDHLHAVECFANRIFHTHAKDTEIRRHQLRWVGNQVRGWWRYVIPGSGVIHWGQYIACLKYNGFNGVLSIEHEDAAVGREEGFVQGLRHLRQFA
ncbi:MAG: sugar phosphate isomerase/epimerase family protein [Armatimonadota bacterium]